MKKKKRVGIILEYKSCFVFQIKRSLVRLDLDKSDLWKRIIYLLLDSILKYLARQYQYNSDFR